MYGAYEWDDIHPESNHIFGRVPRGEVRAALLHADLVRKALRTLRADTRDATLRGEDDEDAVCAVDGHT